MQIAYQNQQLTLGGVLEFAEVQYYFLSAGETEEDDPIPYALVSLYGRPNADILEESYHTLWACKYNGSENLCVVNPSSILSVVSMQPLPQLEGDPENLWFVAEKSGLDDVELTGYVDPIDSANP